VLLLTCFSTASCAWLLQAKVYQGASWPEYITMAAPLLLAAFMLAVTLVVGLTSNILLDEDREWLSRAAAWMLVCIVSWVSLSVLVLLAPDWVMRFPKWIRTLLATGGAAGGWVSALGGLSSKTKAQKGAAPPQMSTSGLVLDLATKLAAPIFLAVFLTGLAILTNWLLSVSGLTNAR